MPENEVKLRYCKIPADVLTIILATGKDEDYKVREKILAACNVERRQGEEPLSAWIRAMAEENGIGPEQDEEFRATIRREMEFNRELARFVFAIA